MADPCRAYERGASDQKSAGVEHGLQRDSSQATAVDVWGASIAIALWNQETGELSYKKK